MGLILTSLASNIAMSLLFVGPFGMAGVALGTVGAFAVFSLGLVVIGHRIIGRNVRARSFG